MEFIERFQRLKVLCVLKNNGGWGMGGGGGGGGGGNATLKYSQFSGIKIHQ